MIRQLTYLSTAERAHDSATLEAILAVSRTRNAARGITGLLAYGGGVFLQVLEGAPDAVGERMEVITRDPRHFDLKVLEDHAPSARSFVDWSMGYEPIDLSVVRRDGDGFVDLAALAGLAEAVDSPLVATFLRLCGIRNQRALDTPH